MSDVQIAPPDVQKVSPFLGETKPNAMPFSRKRKLEAAENNGEVSGGEKNAGVGGENNSSEKNSKKLKWETIQRIKTGLDLEYAIYFNKDETKLFFQNLENEIQYLR